MESVNSKIIDMLNSGCTNNEIVSECGVSKQYITRLKVQTDYKLPEVCTIRNLSLADFEYRTFGKALRYYRNTKGWTLDQAAGVFGITGDNLLRTEEDRGKLRTRPTSIMKYARRLGITENELRNASGLLDRPGSINREYKSDDEDRFWTFVKEIPGSCWEWPGRRNNHGYGDLSISNKKHILAHRFSWMIVHGEMDSSVHICHKCDNPICVNPDHLFRGNYAINTADKVEKGRQPKGSTHPNSKLKELDIVKIREMCKTMEYEAIAKEFNVTPSLIGCIKRRTIWKHVS